MKIMKERSTPSAAQAPWLEKGWIRALLSVCVAAVAVMIFLFSSQSGSASSAISDRLAEWVVRLVNGEYPALPEAASAGVMDFAHRLVRKCAHFAEFALLGFFLRLLAGSWALRRPNRWCVLAGAAYACTDEVHQLFVAQRAGMWQDVLLDACGVLAGVACAYALLVIVGRIRARMTKKGGDGHEPA